MNKINTGSKCTKVLPRIHSALIATLIAVILLGYRSADAEPVAVIVNASNPVTSLSIDEIRKYYENDSVNWPGGSRVVFYDLPVETDTRKIFSEKILGRSPEEVSREWYNKKITNTAKNPPITLILDVLVQKRVSMSKGAIGYIPKSKVSSSKVKVVAVID